MRIEGIILAAGLSSRFPSYKMKQKMGDKTVIQKTVETMVPYVDRIIVVTGFNHELIENLLSDYDKVTCIYNDNYEEGMFSSIKKGVEAIKGERFFLIPGDCPSVDKTTYQQLLAVEGDVIVPSYGFKSGHPILLSQNIKLPLLSTEAVHLRAFLSAYDKVYVTVEDEGVLKDIDTEEDYKELIRGLSNENH